MVTALRAELQALGYVDFSLSLGSGRASSVNLMAAMAPLASPWTLRARAR